MLTTVALVLAAAVSGGFVLAVAYAVVLDRLMVDVIEYLCRALQLDTATSWFILGTFFFAVGAWLSGWSMRHFLGRDEEGDSYW